MNEYAIHSNLFCIFSTLAETMFHFCFPDWIWIKRLLHRRCRWWRWRPLQWPFQHPLYPLPHRRAATWTMARFKLLLRQWLRLLRPQRRSRTACKNSKIFFQNAEHTSTKGNLLETLRWTSFDRSIDWLIVWLIDWLMSDWFNQSSIDCLSEWVDWFFLP